MTSFTFVGNLSDQSVNWTDPTVWSGNAAPDDPSAVVLIPTVFRPNTVNVYQSTILLAGTIGIGQLTLSDNTLNVGGALTVGGAVTVENDGAVDISGSLTAGGAVTIQHLNFVDLTSAGSLLSVGSMQNAGVIAFSGGSLTSTGEITNQVGGVIEGDVAGPGAVAVTVAGFDNVGELAAVNGTLTLTVTPGHFANLSGGTLTGGSYRAGSSTGGELRLDVGALVTTDAANINTGPGGVESFNTALQIYQPLEATLQFVGSGGTLTLQSTDSWDVPLTVEGTLGFGGTLTISQLQINQGGIVHAGAELDGQVIDNGSITTGATTFDGPVTGSGAITASSATFESLVSANVSFEDLLVLDDPTQTTASITPKVFGAQIDLPNVLLSSVTGYSYAGNGANGTLTIDTSFGSPIALKLVGDFDKESFEFANGPANVLIDIAHAATPHDDLLGGSLSNTLLENAAGQVDVGVMLKNGTMALGKVFSDLGPQWSFVGTGDFINNGVDQILIENKAGSVGIGQVVNDNIDFTTLATLAPTSKFVETGDFLGGGSTDFLIETSSGQLDLGQITGRLQGLKVAGSSSETQIGTLGSQWKFVGAGDYLGAGHDQAAIENTLGSVGVGTVTSGAVSFKAVGQLASAQKIVETGDFLGDGKSDFLIDNTSTGVVQVAEVINGALSFTTIDTLGSQWKFVGVGDFLHDDHDQILIENAAGSLGLGEVLDGSVHFKTIATGLGEWMIH